MRLLGVDLGTVRIGIAVAETEPFVTTPRPFLTAAGSLRKDAAQVARIATVEKVERVIVGLPLESGEEGRMAGVMRRFGAELEALGCTVGYADEAMTSVKAGESLAAAGLTIAQSRRRKDGEVACRILEAYAASPK
ncbi:MAG: Holliday junction resolvase RuvX [Armatimonadota bacterium]